MQIEVLLERHGRGPLRVSPHQESVRFSTAALGGFQDASFRLDGDPAKWKRQIPHLATVRLIHDTMVIWEGRVEDIALTFTGGNMGASFDCYGYQRILDDVSVKRIWVQRDIDWFESKPKAQHLEITTGAYDLTDLSKIGIQWEGNAVALTNGTLYGIMRQKAPDGITYTRLLFTYAESGGTLGNRGIHVRSSTNGSAFTNELDGSAAGDAAGAKDVALTANTRVVELSVRANANHTPGAAVISEAHNIRLLGETTLGNEDAAGGYYGGSILLDLLSYIQSTSPEAGLIEGMIETGDDFVIETMDRGVRSSCRSVVDEVASYYERYWAVWEERQFEWMTHHLDEPQWIATIADLGDGSEIRSTVDGTAHTVYVLYTDVDGREKEKTAESSEQRNPWVRAGLTRDELIDIGSLVARGFGRGKKGQRRTGTLAQQRANRLAQEIGRYPVVEGTLTFPAERLLRRPNGGPLPAYMIRGGDTITIADLPKTDIFSQGRDGETLFHVVSAEADMDEGIVTLDIEGQTTRSDVILARLAAFARQ